MKRLAGAFLAVFLVQCFSFAQQTQKGSIEGVVVRAGTADAVAGALVTLSKTFASGGGPGGTTGVIVGGGVVAGIVGGVVSTSQTPAAPAAQVPAQIVPLLPAAIPPVTTDNSGKFSFKNLDAGAYRIMVAANGYVRQEYGQRALNGQGTPVFLTAGQTLQDLAVRLIPAGTVSGRILEESGQPAWGAPVQLLRVAYNPQGQRTFQVGGSAYADDRGEYRMYGVTPGRYYLTAGTPPGPPGRPGLPGNPNQVSVANYAFSYYPNATDPSQASLIEVKAASEISVDMRIARQQTYHVRGRVIDSRTGQAPPAVNVSLNYQSITGGSGGFSSGRNYDPSTGAFDLQNVSPGPYVVQAQIQEALPSQAVPDAAGALARAAAVAARPAAAVPVHVTDSDIEDLVLTLTTGASVQGRLSIEGQALSTIANPDRIRVLVRPAVNGVAGGPAGAPTSPPTAADGTFRVDGVREGEYLVTIAGVPPGFYVKTARLDGADALGKPVRFSGSGSGTMEIVLSPKPGQLSGVVTDARSQPVPGIQAVLIPDERDRSDLYKTAVTDQNGRFTMTGISPGAYKIFSWEAMEQFAYYDPDFMKRYDTQGKAVRIQESSSENADLKIITDQQ